MFCDVRIVRLGRKSFDKLAPYTDQTKVYEAVFDRLRSGGCVGIFPEGGSHDRTELLPLKAGVAIMALGALAESPDCGPKLGGSSSDNFNFRDLIQEGIDGSQDIDLFRTGCRVGGPPRV